jgi:hypothetical protein
MSIKQDKLDPEAVLVFPPLVETNFGSYYPSTAVLTGYLRAKGINCIQADLNEDFAMYLLKKETLEYMVRGVFGDKIDPSPSSMPAVAARLLTRFGHLLIDDQGKHLFREDSSDLAYLLNILAEPYKIDVPLSIINIPRFFDRPEIMLFRAFFKATSFCKTLPPSIHTVGISIAVGPQLVPALILARFLKTLREDLTVVFGGPIISLMTLDDIERMMVSNTEVDAVVRSDGEYPFEALLRGKRAGNWKPWKVPGVSCLQDSQVVHRPPAKGPKLDSIPYADYDDKLLALLAKPDIGILQSRGCYWGKCAYCDYVELYKGNPRFRTKTPKSFVDEMEYQVKKHGVHNFSVITEAITPAAAKKISQLIINRDLQVKWHSFAMVDKRFTKDVFKALVSSGCEYLVIGMETMTNRVLRLMSKAATQEDAIRFVLDAKACGLDLKLNLIPNLPTTTYQEAMSTLEEVGKLQDCFIYVSTFPFEATRSSRIGYKPEAFGLCGVDSELASGQAQFTLNHLEVLDQTMNAQEREHVFAEYHAFAAQVNNRGIIDATSDVIDEDDLDNIVFRIADEFLDFVELEDGIQCYNWLNRKRFTMPREWQEIVKKMRSEKKFKRTDFVTWLSTVSSGKFYFRKLLEMGILVRYKPEKLVENKTKGK